MRLFSLAFLSGILLLQSFSYLPSRLTLSLLLGILLCCTYIFFKKTKQSQSIRRTFSFIVLACVTGFVWCLVYVYLQMSWTLPQEFEGQTLESTGYIASIPSTADHMASFLFVVKKLKMQGKLYSKSGLVRLTYRTYEPGKLHVGDKWFFTIKLKKIHSTQNPGGFDFEAHALHEGIRASGYVVVKKESQLLQSAWYHYPIYRLRELIKNNIEKNLPKSETSPWITALVVGERQGIAQENWEILRNTGTNHLMAIAGLHIGFMSGFIYFLVNKIWRLSRRLMLRMPAQLAASIAALMMGLFYSFLAGFSIPTQRACIMLAVFLITGLMRRKTLSWQAWSIALMLVLLINPLSVLTQSFWLSFGAVALIIYGVSARLAPKGFWWKWGRIQWVTAIGLTPICFSLFQQSSVVSFAANAIAIPWVGFLIVPLSLVGSFLLFVSAKWGGVILYFADQNLHFLWIILTWFAHISGACWFQAIPHASALIAGIIGVILLLMPIGFPGRWLGLIGFIPIFNFQPAVPPAGDVWFTLLDVGQGLSTVVQTQHHLLVFDAGPKFNANFDMGESVVLPFVRTRGVDKIDMLVVSHGDNDHIGGVAAILKHFIVNEVKTSVPEKINFPQTSYCLRGQSWEWDKVQFKFLYPTQETLGKGNDSSCVLQISNAHQQTILLTGDIEKFAEKRLVALDSNALSAAILVAPHHGSKTSGVDSFLEAVHPKVVLFPIGYRNRYHFPHYSVVEKYDELGAQQLDTAQEGAISILMNEKISISMYRRSHHYYWNS